MEKSILEQLADVFSGYMLVYGRIVVSLGLGLQLCGVAVFLRGNFRDSQYARMNWVKAVGTAILFVVGMPLASQTLSGLLVWLVPLGAGYVDVLNLLALVSPIDLETASDSRPWGYLLTFLAFAGFIFHKIRSLKGRSFVRREYVQALLVLVFAHFIFHLLAYALLRLR